MCYVCCEGFVSGCVSVVCCVCLCSRGGGFWLLVALFVFHVLPGSVLEINIVALNLSYLSVIFLYLYVYRHHTCVYDIIQHELRESAVWQGDAICCDCFCAVCLVFAHATPDNKEVWRCMYGSA